MRPRAEDYHRRFATWAVAFAGMACLALFVVGCNPTPPRVTLPAYDPCVNKQIHVISNYPGTDPPVALLCVGKPNNVDWVADGHTFKIKFVNNESPFADDKKEFSDLDSPNDHTSKAPKPLPPGQHNKYFKYEISVDGSQPPFDPGVIVTE